MSITAEKVEQVARIIDPHKWSLHDAAVGDLYAGYRKSLTSCSIGQATAILSLLQQGEPEGWREAKRIADLWFEPWGAAKAIEWEFSGDVPFTPENALRKIQRLLSASPLPPAPGAETGGRRLGTAEALQFSDFRKLPEGVRKHFEEIEIFLSDVDGKDLATFTEDSALDEGTIDCENVVRAINAIAAWVQSSSRQAVLEEAHPVWRGDVRCAPELGGCWIDDQGKCQHCGFQYERKK